MMKEVFLAHCFKGDCWDSIMFFSRLAAEAVFGDDGFYFVPSGKYRYTESEEAFYMLQFPRNDALFQHFITKHADNLATKPFIFFTSKGDTLGLENFFPDTALFVDVEGPEDDLFQKIATPLQIIKNWKEAHQNE
jgi:hypothetical protein